MYIDGEIVMLVIVISEGKTKGWYNRETHPRIVSRILMKKSALQPEMRKTPSGGTSSTTSVNRSLVFPLLRI